jgi:hypothetical protein
MFNQNLSNDTFPRPFLNIQIVPLIPFNFFVQNILVDYVRYFFRAAGHLISLD